MVRYKKNPTFDSMKSRNVAGIIMALITATVVIPGMTTYLPFGIVDSIAVPILLFPFIWMGLFIYSYMAKKAWHAWAVMLVLILSHVLLSFWALYGGK